MSKLSIASFTLLAAALLAPFAAHAQAKEKLVLATVVDPRDSYAGRLLELIYAEASRRLQVPLELHTYPAVRASVEALAGNVDGEAARAYEYGVRHPQLVRIDEALFSSTVSAYAHDPRLHLHGWESLRGTSYHVEYRSGYLLMQQRAETVVPAERLSAVSDSQQGLKKLAIGRTDVYIDNDVTVLPLLASDAYRGLPIYQAGVLESQPLYGYLTQRHAALAPRLAATIRQMKAEGLIERYQVLAWKATLSH